MALGEAQQRAIAFRGGHLLILAGPGTGKTETLARRAAALIDEAGASGGEQPEILMLTFARKAARELRDRVAVHLRSGGRLPTCSTFHAFSLEVLDRARARALGHAGMLTPAKERLLVERICRATADEHPERVVHFTPEALRSARFASDLANFIGRCKQARVDAAAVFATARASAHPRTRGALAVLASLYQAYEAERERLRLRDFRDLINEAVDALRAEPLTFAHVFVDELQDTDQAQLELLRLLADAGARITAVGDPNQSIYRFRNVAPAAIDEYRAAFSPETIVLDENHRCPPEILTCANRLATPVPTVDPGAPPEPVLGRESVTRSVVSHQGIVRWRRYLDAADEAAGIAREIRSLVGTPRADGSGRIVRYGEIAVLVRAPETHADRLAFALRTHGIPVVRQGASEFLGDPGVDFVLTYLKSLSAPPDAERAIRLLSSPVVGIRARALRFAQRRLGKEAFVDLRRVAEGDELTEEERARLSRFVAAFAEHRSSWQRMGARELVVSIAREHGVVAAIIHAQRDEAAQAASAQRLRALIALAEDVDAVFGRSGTATAHLADRAAELFALLAEEEVMPDTRVDGVHVLSMHAAKGLQFPIVFIAAAVRGELPARPHADPLLDEEAQETLYHAAGLPRPPTREEQRAEELRLFYVACTRASERLILTGYAQDESSGIAESPFIGRIGLETPAPPEDDVLDDVQRALALRRLGADGARLDAMSRSAAERRIVTREDAFSREHPATPPLTISMLSPHAVETYLRCPRQFFYRYIARADGDQRESAHALLGNVVHRALAAFHERFPSSDTVVALGADDAAKALDDVIARALERERRRQANSSLGEQRAVVENVARRACDYGRRYLAWLFEEPAFRVRDRELAVSFTLEGGDGRRHAFTARIDRVDETHEGLIIRDYKTEPQHSFATRFRKLVSAEELPLGQVNGTLQLPLYAAALEQREPGTRVAALELLFVRGKSAADRAAFSRRAALVAAGDAALSERSEAISRAELSAGIRRIADLVGDLRDGRASYAPYPGPACKACPYRLACDRAAVDEGGEENGHGNGNAS